MRTVPPFPVLPQLLIVITHTANYVPVLGREVVHEQTDRGERLYSLYSEKGKIFHLEDTISSINIGKKGSKNVYVVSFLNCTLKI